MRYLDALPQEAVQVNQVFAAIATGDLDRALALTESIFVQEPEDEAQSDLEAELGALQEEAAAGDLPAEDAALEEATAERPYDPPADEQTLPETEDEAADAAGPEMAVGADLQEDASACAILPIAETDPASQAAAGDSGPAAAELASHRGVPARIAAVPDPPAALEEPREPQEPEGPFDAQPEAAPAPAGRERGFGWSERRLRRSAGAGSPAKREGELQFLRGGLDEQAAESAPAPGFAGEQAGTIGQIQIGGDRPEVLRVLCEERDELKSKLARVKSQLQEQTDRRRRSEERRHSESMRYRQTIADLKARRAVSSAFTKAKERELAAVEAERDQERDRREELGRLLASFGLDDTASSLNVLHGALEGLKRLSEGIEAYVEHEREREEDQALVRDAVELERAAAVSARRTQAEQEVSWATNELQRLEDMERELLPELEG
jgi:hypothetical protein